MSGSTIHAALTELVALWRVAAPLGVAVIDGPAYDPPANFLAVGWDRSEQASVSSVSAPMNMAGSQSLESFDVSSLLSFSYDAAEVTTVRGLVFAAFDVFAAALAADQQLGAVVMAASVTAYEMTPILTELGSVMDLRFTTHVEACK